jgi:hypothetical protein
MRSAFIIGLMLISTGSAFAEPLKCTISAKYVCTVAEGCRSVPGSVWNVIDLSRKTYARCDRAGCDTYDARMSQSGAFTNIEVPGRGMLAKLGGAEPSDFVEVATLTGTIYNSFGSCR